MRGFLLLKLFLEFAADEVDNSSGNHSVDRGNTTEYSIGSQVAHNCAHDYAQYCAKVNAAGNIVGIVVICLVGEITQSQNNADGGQGCIQNAQVTAEVPVQPNCGNGAQNAGCQNHAAFAEAGDVGQAQAGGINGIIVGGPNVQTENKDCGPEHT